MARMAYEITEENRRRLELMKAFGVIEGRDVTLQQLVNVAIERLFASTMRKYDSFNPLILEALRMVEPENSSKNVSGMNESDINMGGFADDNLS